MLTLRFVTITTVAGLCLWGLFALLDTLRDPGLLRAATVTIIKGCETLDSEEARAVCPQLFCQQAVIQAKLVSYKSRFAVTVDKEDGARRLIGGEVSNKAPTDPSASFACLVEGARVVDTTVSDRASLEALAAQPGGWSL